MIKKRKKTMRSERLFFAVSPTQTASAITLMQRETQRKRQTKRGSESEV